MLSARMRMDVVSAFRDVGSFREAAEICGVDPKTWRDLTRDLWVVGAPWRITSATRSWTTRPCRLPAFLMPSQPRHTLVEVGEHTHQRLPRIREELWS